MKEDATTVRCGDESSAKRHRRVSTQKWRSETTSDDVNAKILAFSIPNKMDAGMLPIFLSYLPEHVESGALK